MDYLFGKLAIAYIESDGEILKRLSLIIQKWNDRGVYPVVSFILSFVLDFSMPDIPLSNG